MQITKTVTTALLLGTFLTSCVLGDESDREKEIPVAERTEKDDIDTDILYSHGPMKQMMPEQLLGSLTKHTGHSWAAGDPTAEYSIEDPENPGPSSYYEYCNGLGGCVDHVNQARNPGVGGLTYVLTLDRVASQACINDGAATRMLPPSANLGATSVGDAELTSAIEWQYKHLLGAAPTVEELRFSKDYFASHLEELDADTGEPTGEGANHNFESALRGHCMGLVTSAKYLYY